MFSPVLLLPLLTPVAVGADSAPHLFQRQTVVPVPCSSQGLQQCGESCIALTDTCCPSKDRGCPFGTFCDLGSNGEYGCCQIGRVCSGPGGAVASSSTITEDGTTTSTQTVLIPGETSVVTEIETVTTESTEDLVSTLTSTSTSVITLKSTPTFTSTSTSFLASNSVPTSLPPPPSNSSTQSSNSTFSGPTATTLLPEFTGAADGRMRDNSMGLLAIILPLMVV